MPAPTFRNALAMQSMLQEYRIDQVLGAGGFGITYRARDTNLDKDVAIKEYLPGQLAMRAPDGAVVAQGSQHEEGYQWGLDRFLQEARTLAKFSHPNIVRVLRFFQANATAYVVMDYEQGDPLKTVLQLDPQPPETRLKEWLAPLLDGLHAVHAAGFLHRDIKPDNIFIRADGKPVLIDFGAARQALGGETKSLTSILTPGYAPLEQYSGEGKQGPWTDLYAMGGVLYRAVTDKNPPDAVSRVRGDSTGAGLAAAKGKYSEGFLQAIEWALRLDEKMRPQSVDQWKPPLLAERRTVALPRAGQAERRTERRSVQRDILRPAQAEPSHRRRWWPYAAGVLALALLAGYAIRANNKNRLEAEQMRQYERDLKSGQMRAQDSKNQRFEVAAVAPKAESPAAAAPKAEAPAKVAAAARPEPVASAPAVAATSELPERFAQELRREFRAADANGDGYLSRQETQAKFPYLGREFSRVDQDGDGRISLQELARAKRLMFENRFGK
jgi:serine/threonine protein kinase